VTGGGPSFHKAGRWPLYDPDELDEWASGLTLLWHFSPEMQENQGLSLRACIRLTT
jgi:hypothetical protein